MTFYYAKSTNNRTGKAHIAVFKQKENRDKWINMRNKIDFLTASSVSKDEA